MHLRPGKNSSAPYARIHIITAAAACALIAGCGNVLDENPGASADGRGLPLGGRDLHVIAADPADLAVQVAVDAPVTVEFDGPIAAECLESGLTGLFVAATDERVDATFELGEAGHRVSFRPVAPLPRETDFELRLDPLTCDLDGRVLDEPVELSYRTIDSHPPSIVGWSHGDTPQPVRIDQPVVLRASEALDPTSLDAITLSDDHGRPIAADLEHEGDRIVLRPVRDLPGSFDFVVAVRGLRDRSGNRIESSWSRRATSAADYLAPRLLEAWPPVGRAMSPLGAVLLRFDESVVLPAGAGAVAWRIDGASHPILHRLETSRDGRTVWVVPIDALAPGSRCSVRFDSDSDPLTDGNGTAFKLPVGMDFEVGADGRRPEVVETNPIDGAARVPTYVVPHLRFDEPIDPRSLSARAVTLIELPGGTPVTLEQVQLAQDGASLRAPTRDRLTPDTAYELRVLGGLEGLCDAAGNALASPVVLRFRTNADSREPHLRFWPAPSSGEVASNASLVAASSLPLDPASVHAGTVTVARADGQLVGGDLALVAGNRTFRFTPGQEWDRGATYVLRAHGGPEGVRSANGNWLLEDAVLPFRAGYRVDVLPPRVAVTLDGVAAPYSEGRAVAPSGISIEVRPVELYDPSFDPTTVELEIEVGGQRQAAAAISPDIEYSQGAFRVRIPADSPLPVGPVSAFATARDLSGNRSEMARLDFVVLAPDAESLPFERTQVVWVRFDLDRDGNGRTDFEDDLIRLGLCAEGDPLTRNARMVAVVRDGVLAQARRLFHRRPTGGPLGAESVPVRLSHRRPLGVAHMEIACGGFDPEGALGRRFPAPSTGVLGRAWFDHLNASTNERNTSTRPGLGVFPSELWLFEARVHDQLYPTMTTAFGRRFLTLAPELGGIPAGAGPVDSRVLDPGFDPRTAPTVELARWEAVFAAADDWATAIGTILAHETGHAVGLTAPGIGRTGLHGDASLHNVAATPTDVMAAAIGFDALVTLEFGFRSLNLAYLRQRILLR